MKTVYRVEHPISGIGPYRHEEEGQFRNELISLMGEEHSKYMFGKIENNPHPGGYADFSDFEIVATGIQKIQFGFESMEQLVTWFDTWLDYLFEMGFVISEYLVDSVVVGKSGKQVIFNKDKATFNKRIIL